MNIFTSKAHFNLSIYIHILYPSTARVQWMGNLMYNSDSHIIILSG